MIDSPTSQMPPLLKFKIFTRSSFAYWYKKDIRFLLLILFTTLFPLCLLSCSYFLMPQYSALSKARDAVIFLSNSHVCYTLFFYIDPRMYEVIHKDQKYYYHLPLIIILGNGLYYQFAPVHLLFISSLIFHAWLLYHYMKQNVGIVSFISKYTNSGGINFCEETMFRLGSFAGILGFIHILKLLDGSPFDLYSYKLFSLGQFLYLFCFLFFILSMIQNPKIVHSPLRFTSHLLAFLFFLPTFIFENQIIAASSYGVAHGMQYILYMGYFAGHKNDHENNSVNDHGLLMLMIIGIFGSLFLLLLNDSDFWFNRLRFVIGAFYGITMAHFVIDGDIWKLSKRVQGKYLKETFSFLLHKKQTNNEHTQSDL